ncbi:unnamed protein product [Kuraishia capsulata CBS 1993]|uniref:Holocytochrome c-type synthase n=1 Tax=Kuraishia capsulata CBS 1993 TaxID=1382522 RepID=W6MJX7_9ASCO|nr:uncharacterized protein KUCA_T00002823001 [Kuraishia capsulata CBS 1993]CDK26849.1 unnamed protein product [Kuraishia capsulata CBS 1993]
MGWFWADNTTTASPSCPVPHSNIGSCPVQHSKQDQPQVCPVNHKGLSDKLNPLNQMPYSISSNKAPGQKIELPKQRTMSTIPKGESTDSGNWEYPSPQQMFNAMIKKGKGDVPEDAVESMVDVHNFLNEGAWQEILNWEQRHTAETKVDPRLLKFTGRPDDLSPRARTYSYLGKVFPSQFGTEPPFDRHDWTVLRSDGQSGWKQVRYVIDYYGGPDDEDGMPSFYLDVRPALDNVSNALDRFEHWSKDLKPLWEKALGRTKD